MSKIDLRNYKNESESSESDFFSLPTGDTKLRVMTDFVEVKTAWEGEYPNSKPMGIITESNPALAGQKVDTKGWAWALIRGVNGAEIKKLKIVKFGSGILGMLAKLKGEGDYTWEDMPMPFDVTISNSGNGPARYTITPARSNTPVTESELKDLADKKPIEAIVESIVAKQGGEKKVDYPTEDSSLLTDF